jgi:glycosyltransferase involved in cell wall biosynthesis
LGFVPEAELPLRYAAADCTVMPSLDLEGFGLATVEALACGTPVLGSRRRATPEILEPLDNALLYDSRDELVRKMKAAVANPRVLPTREKCREYAVANFSWDKPVAELEKVCSSLFSGGTS